MARKWRGFLPQNLNAKEEWEFLEACEAKAAVARQIRHMERKDPMGASTQRRVDPLPERGRAKR